MARAPTDPHKVMETPTSVATPVRAVFEEVAKLAAKQAPPLNFGHTTYRAYVIKKPLQGWPLPDAVLELLKNTRSSYLRYGPVPLVDKYDPKSGVVMMHIEKPCACGLRAAHISRQWYGIRFIPAMGEPSGVDDYEICTTTNGPLPELIHSRLLPNEPNYLDALLSVTRICATTKVCSITGTPAPGKETSLESFWLLNKLFFDQPEVEQYRFMSGLFRPELIQAYSLDQASSRFTKAYALLGLEKEEQVFIKRNPIAFAFPGYHFRKPELDTVLQELTEQEAISAQLAQSIATDNYRNAGQIFLTNGPIQGSTLTGETLRERLNARLHDGPTLYLMDVAAWKKTIDKTLAQLSLSY